ncbi:ParA family protein [Photobacterium sp. GSS17]|uniref:ParA family protein n=1 Tax=Photobacterium sp. GSS17 TaxID=3020715 RepID=UPI0023620753|nr:ParA family protein [Photobacterium sp. GSS17]
MQTIGVLAPKGGVGKTTVSIHTAIKALESGRKVAIMDTDYPQGSMTKLCQSRSSDDLIYLNPTTHNLDKAFKQARDEAVDLVIIDGTPKTSHNFQHYAPYCDLILSPMRTSRQDREAVGDTLSVIPMSVYDRLYFLLNHSRPKRKGVENTKTQQVREFLTANDLRVCPVALTGLTDYEDSLEFNQTVTEYNPKGTAATEINELWHWIVEELNNGKES